MKFREAYDHQILKMTDTFYKAYPNPPFQEILQKTNRAYDCLLLQAHYDYFICIPYRSHISHPYAYHFRESARSRKSHSGLDYSKTVIIQNPEYITSENAIIDHDEYVETITNIEQIRKELSSLKNLNAGISSHR